jgi:hypothetical protein
LSFLLPDCLEFLELGSLLLILSCPFPGFPGSSFFLLSQNSLLFLAFTPLTGLALSELLLTLCDLFLQFPLCIAATLLKLIMSAFNNRLSE